MRSKERLKEIFMTEANYMLDHYFGKANKIATGIIEHQNVTELYEEYKDISKMQMDKYHLTNEEQEVINANVKDWQAELMPLIVKKLYPDFNPDTK